MEINGIRIDDARLIAARDKFEQAGADGRTVESRVTFDELLKRVTTSCGSLAEIGSELGVSRAMMCLAHQRYFQDLLLDGVTGRQRLEVSNQNRSRILEEDFSGNDIESWVKEIAAAARVNGLSVKRCKQSNLDRARLATARSFKKCEIFVNGWRCALRRARNEMFPRENQREGYSVFAVRRGENGYSYDFFIVCQEVCERKIFVIPAAEISARYGDRRDTQIYLPMRQLSEPKGWLRFVDAWEPLKVKA